MKPHIRPFPNDKQFAFTFTDDADDATVATVKAMYEYLDSVGIKATKTVWVYPATRRSGNPEPTGKQCPGISLSDPAYLDLVKDIQSRGHEIALHLASGGNNLRQETINAYEFFKQHFGQYPRTNVNHGRNADSIYWCRDMLGTGLISHLTARYCRDRSEGHVPGSPYFWGDYARNHTQYIRHFKSLSFDTLHVNPSMPYHEPGKPFVNRWFGATDISDSRLIKRIITPRSIQQAMMRNGACIGYSYLHRFVQEDGSIDPIFADAMELLRSEAAHCWFTPASTLLDRLETMRNVGVHKDGLQYRIVNSNPLPVQDAWIDGEPGTVISVDGCAPTTIGVTGTANLASIPPTRDRPSRPASLPLLRPGEKATLILRQIHLLIVRHKHGRPLQTQGWR